MKMEPSLKLAIAHAKRNAYKYGSRTTIDSAVCGYYLRADEIPILVNSFNKWAEKNYCEKVNADDVVNYYFPNH